MTDDRPAAKASQPPDPFAMWREWVTQSEHQMNKMFNDMMGTEEFARASGSWVEAMTMFQQTMNENAQRYFEMAGVPTRTDMGDLAERLTAVEERLQRIEALLAAAVGRKDVADRMARPARTRRPPSEQRAEQGASKRSEPRAAARLVDAVPAEGHAAPARTEAKTK